MKKTILLVILGILFNCKAGTTKESNLSNLDLNLNSREYTKHGKWTMILNKITEKGNYLKEKHQSVLDSNGNTSVSLELGSFNIISLTFQYRNDLKSLQRNRQLFLKKKSTISLSCKIEDETLKIDSKDLNDKNNIAFKFFLDQLYEIMKEPGAFSRKGEDAEKFALRFMEFTNDFIKNNKSIDKSLKTYLKIQGYNQSLFRNIQMVNSDVFNGDFYDMYDSELILFDNLSQIILKQYIDKSLTLDRTSQIKDLEKTIKFINKKISNPSAKEAIITRYFQSLKNNYVFNSDSFESDLCQFKVLAKNLNNVEQRNELIALFVKTGLTEIGGDFPSIEFKNTDGNIVKSNSLFSDNKYVYIDIWASWCMPCVKEIPALKVLEKEYVNKNIKFVSISIDSKTEAWHKALKKYDLHGYQFIDQKNQIGKILNIQGIPRFLLYDPKGKLVSINAPRPSAPEIRDLLNKFL
jgi:thiol-disulfide isomerase/thioredoxin